MSYLSIDGVDAGRILWLEPERKNLAEHNIHDGAFEHPCVIVEKLIEKDYVGICLLTGKVLHESDDISDDRYLDKYLPIAPNAMNPEIPGVRLKLVNGVRMRKLGCVNIGAVYRVHIKMLRPCAEERSLGQLKLIDQSLNDLRGWVRNRLEDPSLAPLPEVDSLLSTPTTTMSDLSTSAFAVPVTHLSKEIEKPVKEIAETDTNPSKEISSPFDRLFALKGPPSGNQDVWPYSVFDKHSVKPKPLPVFIQNLYTCSIAIPSDDLMIFSGLLYATLYANRTSAPWIPEALNASGFMPRAMCHALKVSPEEDVLALSSEGLEDSGRAAKNWFEVVYSAWTNYEHANDKWY